MKKTLTKAVVVCAVLAVMVTSFAILNSRVIDPPLPPSSCITTLR